MTARPPKTPIWPRTQREENQWRAYYDDDVRRRDEALGMLKGVLLMLAILGAWALAHWLGWV